jgi:peptide/nickel transport system permease protein
MSIAFFVGAPLGVIAGYYGRGVDAVISRFSDALQSVPGLILALAIVAALGPGLVNGMIAIGILSIPAFYRISRAATQDIRGETFIEAAQALGCSQPWTMWRHIVPNVMSPVAVQLSLGMGAAITAEASLSFLGLGVKAPTASWGSMLSAAARNIERGTHLVVVPGVMITITVLALTFLGDGLREALGTRRIVGE